MQGSLTYFIVFIFRCRSDNRNALRLKLSFKNSPSDSNMVDLREPARAPWNTPYQAPKHKSIQLCSKIVRSHLRSLPLAPLTAPLLIRHHLSVCTGSQSYPRLRGGGLGGLWGTQGSGTCLAWGGAHYRTFDRKHFHFQGSCTYILASSTEGTWAVYISSVCDGQGRCGKVPPKAWQSSSLISTTNHQLIPLLSSQSQTSLAVHELWPYLVLQLFNNVCDNFHRAMKC